MQPSQSKLWREVLDKLGQLQDEVKSVEELVHRRLGLGRRTYHEHTLGPAHLPTFAR